MGRNPAFALGLAVPSTTHPGHQRGHHSPPGRRSRSPNPSSLAERPLWPVSAPAFVMSPKLSSWNLADPSHPAPMEGSRKHEPPILTHPFEAP